MHKRPSLSDDSRITPLLLAPFKFLTEIIPMKILPDPEPGM
jgi:hypothetical protein